MTQDKNISTKVLDKIKQENIEPKPKWQFLLHNYTLWVVGIIFLVIGGFAFSVIFYMLENNNWELYSSSEGNFTQFVFASIPYFWITILLIFIAIFYYNFKHTKRAYKYPPYLIISCVILISAILGSILNAGSFGNKLDTVFEDKVPVYKIIMKHRKALWDNPEKGLLIGSVNKIIDKNHFILQDIKRNEWRIECIEHIQDCTSKLHKGIPVRIFGKSKNDFNFQAKIIKPEFERKFFKKRITK